MTQRCKPWPSTSRSSLRMRSMLVQRSWRLMFGSNCCNAASRKTKFFTTRGFRFKFSPYWLPTAILECDARLRTNGRRHRFWKLSPTTRIRPSVRVSPAMPRLRRQSWRSWLPILSLSSPIPLAGSLEWLFSELKALVSVSLTPISSTHPRSKGRGMQARRAVRRDVVSRE